MNGLCQRRRFLRQVPHQCAGKSPHSGLYIIKQLHLDTLGGIRDARGGVPCFLTQNHQVVNKKFPKCFFLFLAQPRRVGLPGQASKIEPLEMFSANCCHLYLAGGPSCLRFYCHSLDGSTDAHTCILCGTPPSPAGCRVAVCSRRQSCNLGPWCQAVFPAMRAWDTLHWSWLRTLRGHKDNPRNAQDLLAPWLPAKERLRAQLIVQSMVGTHSLGEGRHPLDEPLKRPNIALSPIPLR